MNCIQGTCEISGCTNKQTLSHRRGGKTYYHRVCSTHRKRQDIRVSDTCVICCWRGPCDTHRIVPGQYGGRYVAGNMLTICPNCHRLIHSGLLNLVSQPKGWTQRVIERPEGLLFALEAP